MVAAEGERMGAGEGTLNSYVAILLVYYVRRYRKLYEQREELLLRSESAIVASFISNQKHECVLNLKHLELQFQLQLSNISTRYSLVNN